MPTPSSQAEVIFYSSAIASAYGAATVLFTGELFDAFDHSMSNPVVVPLLASAAVRFRLCLRVPDGCNKAEALPPLAVSSADDVGSMCSFCTQVCGYFSVTFVLLLIKHFGATNTEIVKSLRKARTEAQRKLAMRGPFYHGVRRISVPVR